MPMIAQVADSLLAIEAEMRRLSIWASEPPPASALESSQPFCIDTLEFTEWLQFFFLPRMTVLVEQGQALPALSGIAPMAEEYFRGQQKRAAGLIRELEVMDQSLSGSSG